METHSQIITRLGGIRRVAALLGHENPTTVQGWVKRNKIPVDHWPKIIQIAEKVDEPLTANDLVPPGLRAA